MSQYDVLLSRACILVLSALACALAHAVTDPPCLAVRSLPPLDDSPSSRYLRTLELLTLRRHAFSPETLALLADWSEPLDPFSLEDGVLKPLHEHPFRATMKGLIAEGGLDWPWLKREIARLALSVKEGAGREREVAQKTSHIFHVGKPEWKLVPNEIEAIPPERVLVVRGPGEEQWIGTSEGSWSLVARTKFRLVETGSKHEFFLPDDTSRSMVSKAADGSVRSIAYRRDMKNKKEYIDVYDPKTGALLHQVDLDDHPSFWEPVGRPSARTGPLGHFGFLHSFLYSTPEGTPMMLTAWQDAKSNTEMPALHANAIDLQTGKSTVIPVPRGTYRLLKSRDGRDLFVYGWEGEKGTQRSLVVRSLATGKRLLNVPVDEVPGRLHELVTLYEGEGGDLYLAARQDRDGKKGLRFFDLTRRLDKYQQFDGCDEVAPGFVESRDHRVSFVLPPKATRLAIAHPFDDGGVDTIPMNHDITSGHAEIHRTPDGKPFLVAQTWVHVDPTKPNHLFIYDFDGRTGEDYDVGSKGLRGLVGIVDTPDGRTRALFTSDGRSDRHFSIAGVTLYGPVGK